ncbi:MAG: hypothetical protein ABFR36_07935 [Acidobacteriota bacterium]
MYQKTVFFSVIFIVFLTSTLFPVKKIMLSEVRPPFFILSIPGDKDKIDNNRVIYSGNGNRVAEYELLETSGTWFLCKCKEISARINNGCYVKIRAGIPVTKKKAKKREIFVKESVKIRGIRFNKHKKGIFITGKPVPLSIIPELSFSGIKDFRKRIGKEHKKKCRVDFLSPGEIKRYMNVEEEKVLLAEREGIPVLIFCSSSGERENPVSEKILKKLKYEVFLPLKLIIL